MKLTFKNGAKAPRRQTAQKSPRKSVPGKKGAGKCPGVGGLKAKLRTRPSRVTYRSRA